MASEKRLTPLNSPKCPKCGKAEAARGGYDREKKGSWWKCKVSGCEARFLVPTLVLQPMRP